MVRKRGGRGGGGGSCHSRPQLTAERSGDTLLTMSMVVISKATIVPGIQFVCFLLTLITTIQHRNLSYKSWVTRYWGFSLAD